MNDTVCKKKTFPGCALYRALFLAPLNGNMKLCLALCLIEDRYCTKSKIEHPGFLLLCEIVAMLLVWEYIHESLYAIMTSWKFF